MSEIKKFSKFSDEKNRKLIGRQLAFYRNMAEFTQQFVSVTTGISINRISQIENGKIGCSASELRMFCELYKASPNQLLNYEPPSDKLLIDAQIRTELLQMTQEELKYLLDMARGLNSLKGHLAPTISNTKTM